MDKPTLYVIGGFVVFFLIAGNLMAPEMEAKKPKAPSQPQINYAVIRQCKEEIKEVLVAPSTARFKDGPVWLQGPLTEFDVDVDSQNGFGAMLRSEWTCRHDATTNRYTVVQR